VVLTTSFNKVANFFVIKSWTVHSPGTKTARSR